MSKSENHDPADRETLRKFSEKFSEWLGQNDNVRAYNLIYVDMTADQGKEGRVNINAGLMLSQILYWHGPSKKDGKTRLRIRRDGYFWMAKRRQDWYEECRLSDQEARGALTLLERLELIEKKIFRFNGSPTTHIRVRWEVFLPKWSDAVHRAGERQTDSHNGSGDLHQNDSAVLATGFGQMTPMEMVKDGSSLTERTAQTTAKNSGQGGSQSPPEAARTPPNAPTQSREDRTTMQMPLKDAKQAASRRSRADRADHINRAVAIFYPGFCEVNE